MTNLSEYNKYYRTSNADAVAADILSPKVAYNANGSVTGSAAHAWRDPMDCGIVLYHKGKQGVALETDTLAVLPETKDHILHASAYSPGTSGVNDWNRDALGRYWNATSYRTFLSGDDGTVVPAISDNIRRYKMDFGVTSTVPTSGDFIRIIFNRADANNYWYLQFEYSSGAYRTKLYEFTASALNLRGTLNASSAIQQPTYGFVWVEDFGDTVMYGHYLYETDNAGVDKEAQEGQHYVASRPSKTSTGFIFGQGALGGTQRFRIATVSIKDIG